VRPYLTGHELPPLTDESAYGVLLRISELNGLSASQVDRVFLASMAQRVRLNSHDSPAAIRNPFESLLGWHWQPAEPSLAPCLASLGSILWSGRFRYCPLCMDAGYHSVWHQFKPLSICPIHACMVSEKCAYCRREIGEYRLTPQRLARGFACGKCGQPFSGAAFDLDRHVAWRQQSNEIETRTAPFANWWSEAPHRLVFLAVARKQIVGSDYNLQRVDDEVWTGAIQSVHPFPIGCKAQNRNVFFVTWQIRPALRGSSPREYPSRRGGSSSGRVKRVYCAFLRRLKCTIDAQEQPQDEVPTLEWIAGKCILRRQWRVNQLAFVLLRNSFEVLAVMKYELDFVPDLTNDAFQAAIVENVVQRAAWRAALISAYAVLVTAANNYVNQGEFDYWAARAIPSQFSSIVGCEDDGIQFGVAVVHNRNQIIDAFVRDHCFNKTEIISKLNRILFASTEDAR